MEKEKKSKSKYIAIIIGVVIIILAIILILNNNTNKDKKGQKTQTEQKEVYNLVYDGSAPMGGNATVGGISSENEAMILIYTTKTGESQNAIFKIKNNTKKVMTVSKDDIKITFRYPSDPDTEDTYHIIEENVLNDYYSAEIVKPTKAIKLKAGETTEIEVKVTAKKEIANKTVIGSFFIILNEK